MTTDIDEFEIDPRIERQVWKALGIKPLKQIAEETGLTRDQIIRIREELLTSVDDLSVLQKRHKLIMELEGMAQDARDRAQRMDDEFYSGAINSSVSAIKAVQAELVRLGKDDNSKVQALNALRRREIVKMYVSVVNAGVEEISSAHGIDEDALFEVFNRLLDQYGRSSELETEF